MRTANLIIAGVLLALLVVGGWTGWWFFIATFAERVVRSATDENARPQLAFDGLERSGFPFEVRLTFERPRIAGAVGHGTIAAEAPTAVARLRPWRPRDIQLLLDQGVRYSIQGAAPGAYVRGAAARGRGRMSQDPVPNLQLTLRDVEARPARAAPVRAKTARVGWRRTDAAVQTVDIDLRDILLDDAALFGPHADSASATIAATGPLPRSGAPAEIAAWRAAGGEIRVEQAAVRWGALDLDADGVLRLDQAYRPAGRLDLAIGDHAAMISRLEELGLLNEQAGAAAKMALGLSALGNGGRAAAPLVLADGRATLAGFVIAALGPVCACP